MNIAFILNSAVLSAAYPSLQEQLERKHNCCSYQLDGGRLLSVDASKSSASMSTITFAGSKENSSQYSDFAFPEAGFHVQPVCLVPSMRSRLGKALRNLVANFELPLVRRSAISFGCFAFIASLIFSGSQPVKAETIPACSKVSVQSVSPVQNLLAKTEVDPVNHALRLGSAWGAYAESDSGHTNIPAQHINLPNGQHSNSSHLPKGNQGHTPQVPPVPGAGV